MTSIGHTIVGASIGVASLPVGASRRFNFWVMLLFIVLANFPDIPFPNWSHEFYEFSHSVLINSGLIVLASASLLIFGKIKKISGLHRLIVPIACVWLSHILLDTFYNHARGVAIFWPVSAAQLAVPIPWFSVLPMDPFANLEKILRIFALEILSYSPLLILSLRRRNWKKTRYLTAPEPIPAAAQAAGQTNIHAGAGNRLIRIRHLSKRNQPRMG